MRLDAVTLTGPFLAVGAAPCWPAGATGRALLYFRRRKKKKPASSLSVSLWVFDRRARQNSGSLASVK
jgi:hypothetical protein